MLTFKRKFLDAIRSGEKTQTLRIWKTLRVRAGQKDFIPGIGPIWIDSVDWVTFADLTDADAIPDGFPTLKALENEIKIIYGDEPEGKLYRVRFHLLNVVQEKSIVPVPASEKVHSKLNIESEPQVLTPRSTESPTILEFVREMKLEFAKKMENYLNEVACRESKKMQEETLELTEAQIVEKMVRRCRINRNVCDWNHEPGKSQDFFTLFLQAPRNEQGVPTLDGYRLRSLMRDQCTEELWEEISWIAAEVCAAWTEWQYAVEHWKKIRNQESGEIRN